MAGEIEIVVGTYEEFLLGFKLVRNLKGDYLFEKSFSERAHARSVRCLASSRMFLASGGADEIVQLFHMEKRQAFGTLQQHNGTVTDLEFFDSYLFSSSEDGTICIWSSKNWQCEKTLRGHKAAVHSISVHPSGKMALSVSKDKALRTWNLVKGRSAYVTNIKKVADFVQWSPDGEFFVIGADQVLDLYSVETAGIVNQMMFKKRVNAFCFITDEVGALGDDDGHIIIQNTKDNSCILDFKAHMNRIKAIKCITYDEEPKWLCSVSSDGYLKLWEIDFSKMNGNLTLVCEVDTTCRPTCMTVLQMPP